MEAADIEGGESKGDFKTSSSSSSAEHVAPEPGSRQSARPKQLAMDCHRRRAVQVGAHVYLN